jgi:hypothetical protein
MMSDRDRWYQQNNIKFTTGLLFDIIIEVFLLIKKALLFLYKQTTKLLK